MNSYEFDVTILGGGCIGVSIFAELTRRGFGNVGLVDQGRKTNSATAHSGGILRVFHENAEHVELALRNRARLELYRKARVLSPETSANGSLYFFNKLRYADYHPNLKRMDIAQYPFEVLTSTCGQKLHPEFHWTDQEWAIYEPLGSQLSPITFVGELCESSVINGGSVVDNFKVHRISRYRNQFRLSGEVANVTTPLLILAGGAGMLPQIKALGLNLPLEAKTLTTYTGRKIDSSADLPNYFDRETLDYARLGGGPEVILAQPDSQRILNPRWRGPFEKKCAEDCYAPDRRGYLGQVAGVPQLMIATGWGGTGFKFALEIGKRIADAVEQARPERRKAYVQF